MTVRSSLHKTKGRGARTNRRQDPGPAVSHPLPAALLHEARFKFCTREYDLRGAVQSLLLRCGSSLGRFTSPETARRDRAPGKGCAWLPHGHTLNSWVRPEGSSVPPGHTAFSWGTANAGSPRVGAGFDAAAAPLPASHQTAMAVADVQAPRAAAEDGRLEDFHLEPGSDQNADKQELLTSAVLDDVRLLACYERLVREVVLPRFKALLVEHEAERYARDRPLRFFYQYPPTLRLQPGPSNRFVRAHTDADYGHQPGELNFWLPLTSYALTQTTLWIETSAGKEDYLPLGLTGHGEIGSFHGTLCRHHVPPNATCYTRVSLDFRVGVEGCFDPEWKFKGTSMDHVRRTASV